MTRVWGTNREVRLHVAPPPHRSLIPPERDVSTGRRIHFDRSDKHRRDESPRSRRSDLSHARRLRWRPRSRSLLTAVGAALSAVAVIATVFLLTGHRDQQAGQQPPASAPTATSPPGPTSHRSDGTVTASASTVTTAAASSVRSAGQTTERGSSPTLTTSAPTGLVPELDPERISAYLITKTYTRFARDGGPTPRDPAVGDVRNSAYPCTAGACTYAANSKGALTFPAAVPLFSASQTLVGPGGPTPCDITQTWNFVRRADGSYTGTIVEQPRKLTAAWTPSPDHTYSCSSYAFTQEVILVPVAG